MGYKSAEEDRRGQLLARIQALESQLATARAQLATLDSTEAQRTQTQRTQTQRAQAQEPPHPRTPPTPKPPPAETVQVLFRCLCWGFFPGLVVVVVCFDLDGGLVV